MLHASHSLVWLPPPMCNTWHVVGVILHNLLQAIIHFQPDYSKLAPRFDQLAQELLSQLPVPGSVASLQMTPQGVVRSFYPLKGNEAALNHNLFRGAASPHLQQLSPTPRHAVSASVDGIVMLPCSIICQQMCCC
jgi:sensor domain CHASE-containing protein